MTAVYDMGATELARGVSARKLSAVEAIQETLAVVAERDRVLNACTAVFADEALAEAAAVDRRIAGGEGAGPLAGVPVVVKNLFDVAGVTTLAGARLREGEPAATRDAFVLARLRAAGAVLVAATNMDEYAYGFTTENQAYGTTRNPRDVNHLAGGSSGGSAAAVAAGMAHIALGSDTNGSIRVPASFCGVFGLKPTYGRLSRRGAWPFVASLDHVGPLARTAADLAIAYDVMQGPDAEDPVCADRRPEPVSGLLEQGIGNLRVGLLDGWFRRGASEGALEAVDRVAQVLGGARPVELPGSDMARAGAFAITASEGANLHIENLRSRPEMFDPAIRDRLLAGALLPADLVLQAQRFRRRFQAAARGVFAEFDVLLAPATPCPALAVGQRTLDIGGVEMLARAHIGVYTQPLSYIGLPIIVVPVPMADGLPIGVQVVAAPWAEDKAFRIAAFLERQGAVASPVAVP